MDEAISDSKGHAPSEESKASPSNLAGQTSHQMRSIQVMSPYSVCRIRRGWIIRIYGPLISIAWPPCYTVHSTVRAYVLYRNVGCPIHLCANVLHHGPPDAPITALCNHHVSLRRCSRWHSPPCSAPPPPSRQAALPFLTPLHC